LLARSTTMPVREVKHNLRVEPNCVYVITPNVQMAITRGILKLTPRGKVRGPTRSIDFFLESLAHDRREHCIGVVLSGTATDGTLGLEAIKAEGGVTFAQDDSAKFDSMPRSAAAAGCVDFVLSPEAIAMELARVARHPFITNSTGEMLTALPFDPQRGDPALERPDVASIRGKHGTPSKVSRLAKLKGGAEAELADARREGFKKILLLLRNHCGVDFTLYKSSTIQRRVMRRLVLNQRQTLAEYATFLNGNSKELDALYSDVLIGVTSFFRNPDAFDTLKRIFFPKLLAQRGRDDPVRIWVLGCSSGQEAYSLAMAFAEATANDPRAVKLQIFATDLNETALEKARHGLYANSLAQDVSPERLRRFFVEQEGGWRVTKALREQVVFARQNVASDPPFSRIDLISCRNVLIYLESELQKKIFPAFHYALKPGGFLFLGASESIGQFTELFAVADKKQKIFSKKAAPTPSFRLAMPNARATPPAPGHKAVFSSASEPVLPDGLRGEYNAQREADRISVSQFAPPSVLINAEGQVLQFRGATGAFLEPPSGKASFDVLKMAREGLMLPLRTAMGKAKGSKKPVRLEGVRITQNGSTRTVTLQVIPLRNLKETCFLVLFEDSAKTGRKNSSARAPAPVLGRRETASRIAELERELAETRDYLQSIQEQNEAGTEELQASSEEVQSANEELQSINEELETSKEELESTNEELTTINDEMVSRNHESNRLNADLNNLQISIHTAILLLARDLTIRRFTPRAAKLFNLLSTDLGRSVAGIRHNLDLPDLEILLMEVIDTMSLREREVRDKEGRWYGLRARPYLTLDNKIDGVVVVLSDIDELKRTEREVKAGRDYAEAILRATPVPFLVLRADLRVNTASEAFYRNFEVTPAETEGRLVYELGNGQWNIPQLRELIEKIRTQHTVISDLEVTHEFRTIGRRTMLLHARRMPGTAGAPELILLAIEDITERKRIGDARVAAAEFNRAVLESSPDCLKLLDRQGRLQFMNAKGQFLLEIEDFAPLMGQAWTSLWPAQFASVVEAALEQANRGETARFQAHSTTTSGKLKWWDVIVAPVMARTEEHPTVSLISVSRDVTERKAVEDALSASEERFRNMADNISQLAWICDVLGEVTWYNQRWLDYTGLTFEDMKGWGWMQCLRPDHPNDVEASVKRSRDTGQPWERTFQLRGKDGDYRWFLSRAVPIRNAAGQVVRWFGTNTDVTEQREIGVALAQAKDRVEIVSRAKDVFLAALSHELRTPLTPVLMAAAALSEDERLPADAREQLVMMERNIALEARLIDDMLDVTTVTRGKLRLRAEPCDAHTLIGLAVEIARADADAKQISITLTFAARHSGLVADPARFQQVIWNLLRNAVKFTPRGGQISIATGNETLEGARWLRITVVDSGIGIAPTAVDTIFLPFDQGDMEAYRFGGLGLGLTIARGVVELHGGRISAHSAGIGRGATFVVEFPGAVDRLPGEAGTATPNSSGAISGLAGQIKTAAPIRAQRLLLVEDHESTLETLARLLRRDGHFVVTATTVALALAAAARDQFDLVISDIGLPDGTGNELMEKLRADHGLRGVALSGYGMEEDLVRSRAAGFVTSLVKPVRIADLRSTLAALTS
ncbi:MAG: CheR family methyltransferase, partial [Opitutus sp.]